MRAAWPYTFVLLATARCVGTIDLPPGGSVASSGAAQPAVCDTAKVALTVPMQRLDRAQFQRVVAQLFPGVTVSDTFPAPGTGAVFATTSEFNQVTSVEAEPVLNAALEVALQVPDLLPACTGDATSCARAYLSPLATRAFRRPVTDEELAGLMQAYTDASAQPGMTSGEAVAVAVMALLQMPQFLYLLEDAPMDGGLVALSPPAVAQRLAFVFSNGLPDPALASRLEGPDVAATRVAVAEETLRADAGREVMRGFLRQWLGLDGFHSTVHDAGVAAALERELTFDLDDAIDSSDPITTLLTSNATTVNSVLQAFYGVDAGSAGPNDWRPLALPREQRVGVLTHPLLMTKLGHGVDPSFTRRGRFVRTMLVCDTIPPPPPNVMQSSLTGPDATLLEQAQARVASTGCGGCHSQMDPIGYGFAAFDGLGRYVPSHALQGKLASSEPALDGAFSSLRVLGERLAAAPASRECFARQWLRYALGKTEAPAEVCAVRAAAQRLVAQRGPLTEVLARSAGEPLFVTRASEGAP